MVMACEPTTFEEAITEAIIYEKYMITTRKIKWARPFESKNKIQNLLMKIRMKPHNKNRLRMNFQGS